MSRYALILTILFAGGAMATEANDIATWLNSVPSGQAGYCTKIVGTTDQARIIAIQFAKEELQQPTNKEIFGIENMATHSENGHTDENYEYSVSTLSTSKDLSVDVVSESKIKDAYCVRVRRTL